MVSRCGWKLPGTEPTIILLINDIKTKEYWNLKLVTVWQMIGE